MSHAWVEEKLNDRGQWTRRAGNELQVNCPKCDDIKGHMYLNLEKGLWVCFRCNEKGGFLAFLKMFGLDPNTVRPRKFRVEAPPPEPAKWPASKKIEPGSRAYQYLTKERCLVNGKAIRSNLDDLDIFRWDLQVGAEWPWDSYIFWPVYDLQTHLISMHLRRFQFDGPRALNQPSGMDKVLLGGNHPHYFPCDAVALVEGPYDAAHVTRELMHDDILGMALMGHDITPLQMLQLRNIKLPVLVMLDADAWDQSIKISKQISRWVPAYPVPIPSGDPDEHRRPALLKAIAKALASKPTASPAGAEG